MSARIEVAVAVAASYVLAFLPPLVSGPWGWWWVRLAVAFSLPLIATAIATSLIFAKSIVQRPALWSLAGFGTAVVVSVLGLYFLSHSWVGLVSVVVAAPAAVFFYLITKVRNGPAIVDRFRSENRH